MVSTAESCIDELSDPDAAPDELLSYLAHAVRHEFACGKASFFLLLAEADVDRGSAQALTALVSAVDHRATQLDGEEKRAAEQASTMLQRRLDDVRSKGATSRYHFGGIEIIVSVGDYATGGLGGLRVWPR